MFQTKEPNKNAKQFTNIVAGGMAAFANATDAAFLKKLSCETMQNKQTTRALKMKTFPQTTCTENPSRPDCRNTNSNKPALTWKRGPFNEGGARADNTAIWRVSAR